MDVGKGKCTFISIIECVNNVTKCFDWQTIGLRRPPNRTSAHTIVYRQTLFRPCTFPPRLMTTDTGFLSLQGVRDHHGFQTNNTPYSHVHVLFYPITSSPTIVLYRVAGNYTAITDGRSCSNAVIRTEKQKNKNKITKCDGIYIQPCITLSFSRSVGDGSEIESPSTSYCSDRKNGQHAIPEHSLGRLDSMVRYRNGRSWSKRATVRLNFV